MTHQLRLHRDPDHLAHAAAEAVVGRLRHAVDARGRATFVLAGGGTPSPLYTLLATDYADRVPWAQVHLFWGDERFVPHDDADSNYGTAKRLLVDRVAVPEANVHPIPTDTDTPEAAAAAYADHLRTFFGDAPPVFDLVLLGLGADGHTASLFPGTAALDVTDRWVSASRAPDPPHDRLTLTFPVLDQARDVYFIVAGAGKIDALRCAFGQPSNLGECPAARVQPGTGNLIWWIDDAAAAGL